MLASLAGVVSLWGSLGGLIERNLGFLASLSAGVFVVVVFRLAQEALEHAGSPAWGLGWILAGALGAWALFKFVPVLHTHVGHEAPNPRRLLLADGLHNIGDGIFLAASFAASGALGGAAALSVFVHELVQEISEFFVLRRGGYGVKKALLLNLLVSASILVGAVGGYFFLTQFEVLEAPIIGLSVGVFLVVVLGDLIPHSLRHSRLSHALLHLLWFAGGLLLMIMISLLVGH